MSLFNKCVCLSDEVTAVVFSSQSVFRLRPMSLSVSESRRIGRYSLVFQSRSCRTVSKTAVLVLKLSFSVGLSGNSSDGSQPRVFT